MVFGVVRGVALGVVVPLLRGVLPGVPSLVDTFEGVVGRLLLRCCCLTLALGLGEVKLIIGDELVEVDRKLVGETCWACCCLSVAFDWLRRSGEGVAVTLGIGCRPGEAMEEILCRASGRGGVVTLGEIKSRSSLSGTGAKATDDEVEDVYRDVVRADRMEPVVLCPRAKGGE